MSQTQDTATGPKLPNKDEIAKLPRWAKVAYAARCARRVLPLVKPREGAPSEPWDRLNTAVSKADDAARLGKADRSSELIVRDLVSGIDIAKIAAVGSVPGSYFFTPMNMPTTYMGGNVGGNMGGNVGGNMGGHPANSMGGGAGSYPNYSMDGGAGSYLVHGMGGNMGTHRGDDTAVVSAEGTAAVVSAAYTAADSSGAFAAAARADFDLLSARASKEKWNDDTPVPPDVFGTL